MAVVISGTLFLLSIGLLLFRLTEQKYQNPASVSLMVVAHPPNVTVVAGANITLDCIYNKLVNCVWKRNATIVKIDGRYQYLHAGTNGTNTRNCSISITSVDFRRDNTSWQCSMKQYNIKEEQVQSFVGKVIILRQPSPLSDHLPSIDSANGMVTNGSAKVDFLDNQKAMSNECPDKTRIIGENALLGITIATSTISICLAIVLIYTCLKKKPKDIEFLSADLPRDRLSINSGCSDTDNLIRTLPTISELKRIESVRKSMNSQHRRTLPLSNKSVESRSLCYGELNSDGFLVLRKQRPSTGAPRMLRQSQKTNSDPEIGRNSFQEEENGYLTPKNVIATTPEIETCQRKNPYGSIIKAQIENEEPIYLEVK